MLDVQTHRQAADSEASDAVQEGRGYLANVTEQKVGSGRGEESLKAKDRTSLTGIEVLVPSIDPRQM